MSETYFGPCRGSLTLKGETKISFEKEHSPSTEPSTEPSIEPIGATELKEIAIGEEKYDSLLHQLMQRENIEDLDPYFFPNGNREVENNSVAEYSCDYLFEDSDEVEYEGEYNGHLLNW